VELKAPALERSRLIDAEAKALTAELVALEKPIDDQIKAEERRKEVEKAAREQAEREAAAVIQGRIDAIRALAIIPAGVKAAGISVSIDNLNAVEVSLEAYGDRAGEAGQAKVQTLARLGELHEAAAAFEAEQARIASEREELARLRAEQEAHDKAERDRIAAEQAAEAKRLADERKAFEKEQAAARAEAKKREDADRVRRDEEDRKAREARAAEDLRIARERAELEAQQRAIREAEEAKAAAERKAEQDRLDAIAKQQREAAAAEQRRLDEEAAARRAEAERKHAADMKVREAAPMLLAALKRMRAVAGNIGSSIPELEQALRDADAAIALATGEQA
jgi:colicin import membrane protein